MHVHVGQTTCEQKDEKVSLLTFDSCNLVSPGHGRLQSWFSWELLGSLGATTSFPPLGGAHGPFSAGQLASFGGESLVGVPFKVTPDPLSPRPCVVLENLILALMETQLPVVCILWLESPM